MFTQFEQSEDEKNEQNLIFVFHLCPGFCFNIIITNCEEKIIIVKIVKIIFMEFHND